LEAAPPSDWRLAPGTRTLQGGGGSFRNWQQRDFIRTSYSLHVFTYRQQSFIKAPRNVSLDGPTGEGKSVSQLEAV
jgi:hypothetical protein